MVTGSLFLLREPSRVSAVRRGTAQVIAGLAAAAAIGAALLAGPGVALGDTDHAALVAAMHDGSNFYGLIAGIVPAGAFAGRLIPLPTLALIEAQVGMLGTTVLLCAVIASVLLVGWERLGRLFGDARGRMPGTVLLLAGATAGALLVIAEPHAGWCAMLASWSLLARRRGRWIEAAALGCIAATIDPSAAVLALVMACAAWRDGERREAAGWGSVIVVAAAIWSAHRWTLAHLGLGTVGAGLRVAPFDVALAAILPGAPPWIAAVVLVLSIAGWMVVRGGFASRVAAVAIVGLVVAHAPGMQSAAVLAPPLLPLGLVFAVEAAASIIPAASNRRRITVTRMTR